MYRDRGLENLIKYRYSNAMNCNMNFKYLTINDY